MGFLKDLRDKVVNEVEGILSSDVFNFAIKALRMEYQKRVNKLLNKGEEEVLTEIANINLAEMPFGTYDADTDTVRFSTGDLQKFFKANFWSAVDKFEDKLNIDWLEDIPE